MYKFVLQGIENVEIWPLIALGLFLSVFVIGVVRAVTAKKAFVDHMKNLPLDEEGKGELSNEKN